MQFDEFHRVDGTRFPDASLTATFAPEIWHFDADGSLVKIDLSTMDELLDRITLPKTPVPVVRGKEAKKIRRAARLARRTVAGQEVVSGLPGLDSFPHGPVSAGVDSTATSTSTSRGGTVPLPTPTAMPTTWVFQTTAPSDDDDSMNGDSSSDTDTDDEMQQLQLHSLEEQQRLAPINIARITAPTTWKEVDASPYKDEFVAASMAEMQSLLDQETFEYVDLPRGRRAIRCRMLWSVKYKPNGEVERFKARLVLLGCQQQEGVDYNDTWAPVLHFDSLRLLLTIATILRLDTLQLDVKTAFLNGEMEPEYDVYMQQPERFVVEGQEH